jgi:hypothetical protein
MAQTFLVFDFGANEEAAQRARLTLERWKQSFRLDKKLLLKFDREEAAEKAGKAGDREQGKGESKKASAGEGRIVLMVRLDFSDHEKLSHQRWVDRIPADASFKDAGAKVVRNADGEFAGIAERFDNLG